MYVCVPATGCDISKESSMRWWVYIDGVRLIFGKWFTLQNSFIFSSVLYLIGTTAVRSERLFSVSPHYGMWQPLFCSALTNLKHDEGFVFEVLMVFTWGRQLGKHPRLHLCRTTRSQGREAPPSSNTEEFLHRCWLVALRVAVERHQGIDRI